MPTRGGRRAPTRGSCPPAPRRRRREVDYHAFRVGRAHPSPRTSAPSTPDERLLRGARDGVAGVARWSGLQHEVGFREDASVFSQRGARASARMSSPPTLRDVVLPRSRPHLPDSASSSCQVDEDHAARRRCRVPSVPARPGAGRRHSLPYTCSRPRRDVSRSVPSRHPLLSRPSASFDEHTPAAREDALLPRAGGRRPRQWKRSSSSIPPSGAPDALKVGYPPALHEEISSHFRFQPRRRVLAIAGESLDGGRGRSNAPGLTHHAEVRRWRMSKERRCWPTLIDMSDVKGDLIDLAPGAMKGMRAEQEGMAGVIAELTVRRRRNVWRRISRSTSMSGSSRRRPAWTSSASTRGREEGAGGLYGDSRQEGERPRGQCQYHGASRAGFGEPAEEPGIWRRSRR